MVSDSNLRKLYEKLVESNIRLFSVDPGEHKAVTLKDHEENRYGIFFDYARFENSGEEFEVITHEYGHAKSGCTHKLNTPYQLIGQHETRANRAAVHEFLPFDMLMKAVDKGNKEPWELADALGMPEKFVRMAVETYKIEGKLN